jgi:mRNA interferase YafQ
MRTFHCSRAFKSDLKRVTKGGCDISWLEPVLDALARGEQLPAARLDHPLKGDWKGWSESHIQPDWP